MSGKHIDKLLEHLTLLVVDENPYMRKLTRSMLMNLGAKLILEANDGVAALDIIGTHDNTSANKRNPDPAMWAGFGERSVDDMLQLWINVVYLDEAEFKRLVDERKAKQAVTSTNQQQQ